MPDSIENTHRYSQLIGQIESTENLLEKGQLTELLADFCYHAAFQSTNREEFCRAMKRARDLYRNAAAMGKDSGTLALSKRRQSRELFSTFWIEESSERRKEIVNSCISLSSEAAKAFEAVRASKDLTQTQLGILTYLREGLHLAREWKDLEGIFHKAVETGRKTITEMIEIGNDDGLVEALHLTSWILAVEAEVILDPKEFKQLAEETTRLGRKIRETAQKLGTTYAQSLASEVCGDIEWDLHGDLDQALSFYDKATGLAREIGDSLQIGRLLTNLAGLQHLRTRREEQLEKRRKIAEEGLAFAKEAIRILTIPFHTTLLARAHSAQASCCLDLAELGETDPEMKISHLRRGAEAAARAMTFEYRTEEWSGAGHLWSKANYFLARAIPSLAERARLLRELLPVRQETVSVIDTLQPNSWNRGVFRNYLALTKAELATVEPDSNEKFRLLREARKDMEACLEITEKWVPVIPGASHQLYQYCEWYGDVLRELYLESRDVETANRSVEAYMKAVDYLKKTRLLGPEPTIRWKIAGVFDSVGNFESASKAFGMAADEFDAAAQKIPGSSPAFHELAIYMRAWVSIDKAKQQHSEENYDLSYRTYAVAAKLLAETERWSGLGSLCDARSLLEKGEALSHKENYQAAAHSFRKAYERFRTSRMELERIVRTISDDLRKREFQDWIRIAKDREAYTRGRIELEEARSLDRMGRRTASSKKYMSASAAFKTLAGQILTERDRAEMNVLAQFCESWSLMKEAETKSSPELFADAAEAFSSVRTGTTRPTFQLLALANSSICRALESGTKFRQSRNLQHYSEIKRHLEVASDLYTEAGLRKTGTWTRATQRLFDALMLLATAETTRGIKRKSELYQTAEKHLVLAGKLYNEAGFPSKRKETLEHINRVREEKEVLLAPLEALAEIPTASATHLPSIALRGAQPLGLERFEEADITGEIRAPHREVAIGSELAVSLDMVNVGKTAATLIRAENMIPEGLEPIAQSGQSQIEGSSLDLRGKMLDHLQTHKVEVTLRATRTGTFDIGPRVVFVDQKGTFRSYEFRSRILTVREQAISEGMRAPATVTIPQEFRFENSRSKEVFRQLTKAFLDDYMSKRIVMSDAGWRSLMDVIQEMKIPRSTLYGPSGRDGPVLAELTRRGLVEIRVFTKERGRGGRIKKIRVAYENAVVKGIVEKAAMETT